MSTIKEPKPKLKDGIIYSADNGMLICLHCAGQSAKYSGRDLSGQRVQACGDLDNREWIKFFGKPLSCERGCTCYLAPKA